jgi:hypothetical protein
VSNDGIQAQATMSATKATTKNLAIHCFVDTVIFTAPFEKLTDWDIR